jgi:hypothetical protein
MTIKVIDAYNLMKRHADWGHPESFQAPYQVLAITKHRRIWQYLVVDDQRLKWWDKDLFEVIDEAVPENWVVIQYKRFHKFKNRKYDFQISTNYYQGPKEFLENEDFLFDIYENPSVAYEFYYQYFKWNEGGKDG